MVEFTISAVLAMNLITFVAWGLDKHRAKKGRRRIPESTLLGLAWGTGLVGAWVGMSVFRHKTQKTGFKIKLALLSVVNLAWHCTSREERCLNR